MRPSSDSNPSGGFWRPFLPAFALLCAAFGFAWMFLMPFHFSLAFRADPTGRVAMLIPAMQLLGSALGPLVASFVVTGDDASSVLIVSLGFALAAVALLVFGHSAFARRDLL
jgi:MFS transporter, DHA1 family, inner membrane transport protein